MSWYAVGAAGVETAGDPLPEETRAAASGADAVLLGAVGDPAFDHAPRHLKPETGLLALRTLLGLYANLRPVAIHPALAGRSPVKPDRLRDVDLLIVRELTGGLYYGEPRGKDALQALNTLAYSTSAIERVARVAFQAARGRRPLGAAAGLFEPIHGSAPGIAGQGVANPIGAIASVAMLLRHGLGLAQPADAVEAAVRAALAGGARTKDIAAPGEPVLGTRAMGDRIVALLGARALGS